MNMYVWGKWSKSPLSCRGSDCWLYVPHFTPADRPAGTHWICDSVGPQAILDMATLLSELSQNSQIHGNIADLPNDVLYSIEWWFLLISSWSTAPWSQTIQLRHLSARLTVVGEAVDMAECEQYTYIEDWQGVILVFQTLDSQFVVVESTALDSLYLQWNKGQRHIVRDWRWVALKKSDFLLNFDSNWFFEFVEFRNEPFIITG